MDVFAPGTQGQITDLSITGTPEVAVRVDTVATVTVENWDVDGSYYCPLIFNIAGTEVKGLTYIGNGGGADSFASDLKEPIETVYSGELEAGTKLDDLFKSKTISWEWPYEGTNQSAPSYCDNSWTKQDGQADEKDTKLGNLAANAGSEDAAPKITIDLATTVTQID